MLLAYGSCQEYDTFVDTRDSTEYRIVKIGEQWWFAENLNFDMPDGSICYDEESTNCDTYGRLYTWESAIDACPAGWHLPKEDEWKILINYLGGEDVAGGKMKSPAWKDNGYQGGDYCGFDALPGGKDYLGVTCTNINKEAYFWMHDIDDSFNTPQMVTIYSNRNDYYGSSDLGGSKLSVRCIKNSKGSYKMEDIKDW